MRDKILNVALVMGGGSKSLYLEDMYEIVEKLFKINPATELGVLQKCGAYAKSWNIAVQDADIHDRLNLEEFVGKRFRLPVNGKIVEVNRAFESFTQMVVKDVPPFWKEDIVERIFQSYGRISEIKREIFKFGVHDCKDSYKQV